MKFVYTSMQTLYLQVQPIPKIKTSWIIGKEVINDIYLKCSISVAAPVAISIVKIWSSPLIRPNQ
jgi:hypothetical protein